MPIEAPITCSNPAVSVIVPSIPEHDHARVERALRNQTTDRFEFLLVNDASLDRCEARNAGIEAAAASVVAFTDDDCRPPPTWIEAVIDFFETHPEAVLLDGPVEGIQFRPGGYAGPNIACRRRAALAIGGFDSTFSEWREDTDFGYRMEDHYGRDRCHYQSEPVMEHPPDPRTDLDRELERKFRDRHPHRYYTRLLGPGSLKGKVYVWLSYQLYRAGLPAPTAIK
jgi:glycosyltransferase involved in cell wall biosynthesis